MQLKKCVPLKTEVFHRKFYCFELGMSVEASLYDNKRGEIMIYEPEAKQEDTNRYGCETKSN
jgi:hypothetical protein